MGTFSAPMYWGSLFTSRCTSPPRSRTVQFSRSFVLSCVRLWNGLHESVFAGEGWVLLTLSVLTATPVAILVFTLYLIVYLISCKFLCRHLLVTIQWPHPVTN